MKRSCTCTHYIITASYAMSSGQKLLREIKGDINRSAGESSRRKSLVA
jgi:hypothetical protein